MRRLWQRKFVRFLAVMVVLLVVATVAIRIFLPAEDLQRIVFEQLETRTGLTADAQQVSVSFPWPVGLRLQGLALETPPEGLADGTRLNLKAEDVLVTADLASLLRRQPQVNEVRLVKPQAEIWLPVASGDTARKTAERRDADSPGARGPGASPDADATTPSVALALGMLSIDDGHLVVHSPTGRTQVDGWQQRAHVQVSETGELEGKLETKIARVELSSHDQPEPWELPALEMSMGLRGNVETGVYDVELWKLNAFGAEAKGTSHVDLSGEVPHLDAKLEIDTGLPGLMEHLDPYLVIPEPYTRDMFAVKGGHLRAQFSYTGALPSGDATPADWLGALVVQGELTDLVVDAFGRSELLQASSHLTLADGRWSLSEIEARMPGLRGQGTLEGLASGEPGSTVDGTLQFSVDVVPVMEEVAAIWPRLPSELVAERPDPGAWPALVGHLTTTVDMAMPVGDTDQVADDAFTAVTSIGRLAMAHPSLADSLRLTAGEVVSRGSTIEFRGLRFESRGFRGGTVGSYVTGPNGSRCMAAVHLEHLDLDLMRPKEQEEGAWRAPWSVAVAHAQEAPEEMPAPPADLTGQFEFRCDRLLTSGYTLNDVTADARLENQVLEVPGAKARLSSGQINADARVDWRSVPARWSVDTGAKLVPVAELFAPFAPKLAQAVVSQVGGSVHLEGPLTADTEAMKLALDGGGALRTAAGELQTRPLLGDGLASLPGRAAESFRVLPFQSLSAKLEMREGKVFFNELLLDGPTLVTASGWASLEGQVDYGLTVKLPVGEKIDLGTLSPLTEFLREPDGRITIPIRVSGPAKKPKVQANFSRAEARAKEAGRQALQDGLRNLLGGNKDGGSADADSTLESTADKVKNLLDGLKKKKGK